jgi:hypothetical protein
MGCCVTLPLRACDRTVKLCHMSNRLGDTAAVLLCLILGALLCLRIPVDSAVLTKTEVGLSVYGAANNASVVADAASPCHSARETYMAAKAASTAADNEKALELFQTAIEQFELCRDSETPGSTAALNDEASELDSQIRAGAYFMDRGDDERATSLYESAFFSLTELCFRKSLPYEAKHTLWVDAMTFRALAPRIGLPLPTSGCAILHMPAPTPTP